MTPEEKVRHHRLIEKLQERVQPKLTKVLDSREPNAMRYIKLREIADEAAAIIAPATACRGKGCSHCCYMATNVTEQEAQIIARYSGRKMARPAHLDQVLDVDGLPDHREEYVKRYSGVACTLLDESTGACTVYEVRPIACRVHHSLADDPEPCNIRKPDEEKVPTPSLNLGPMHMAHVLLNPNLRFGDIREFFPPKDEAK